MNNYNIQGVTDTIKSMLSNFRLVGIASKERFDYSDIPSLKALHPSKILENFQSVIVFGDGRNKSDDDNHSPQSFNHHLDLIAAPMKVVKYLNTLGYKSYIIHKSSLAVSLVDMGVKAGVGELSPVNSLVTKDYGLTPVIQAIVTEAPLVQDELPKNKVHCIQCNLCLKVCPIRDVANAPGDLSKCACNKCVEVCPV